MLAQANELYQSAYRLFYGRDGEEAPDLLGMAERYATTATSIALKLLAIWFLATVLLLSATLQYALFYLAIMPGKVNDTPLHFDYSRRGPAYDPPPAASNVGLAPTSLAASGAGGGQAGGQPNGGHHGSHPYVYDGMGASPHSGWGPVATVDFMAAHSQWWDYRSAADRRSAGPSVAEACSWWSDATALSGAEFGSLGGDGARAAAGTGFGGPIAGCAGGAVPVVSSRTSAPPADRRPFKHNTEYSVVLEMTLPVSEVNRALGVFMARVDLHTIAPEPVADTSPTVPPSWARTPPAPSDGGDGGGGACGEEDRKAGTCPASNLFSDAAQQPPPAPSQQCAPVRRCGLLASSRRSAMVPFTSPTASFLHTLAWWPFIALSPVLWLFRDMGGGSPIPMNVNTQKIRIEMYDHFRESSSQRLSAATVTLSDSRLEVYSAKLSITAQLYGMKYLMSECTYNVGA